MARASSGRVQKLAAGSIAIGCAVLALKYLAYAVTGSAALYSDAIESIANVATAVAALIAVWISAKPADAEHPYGHSKAEYFAAVLEGVLIIVAALAILHEAWLAFQHPRLPDAPVKGLAINCAATILNAVWSWVLIHEGRRLRSPALVADGRHLLTDLWTSGGVVAGVILIGLTGVALLDPIIAALMAVNVIWTGYRLMHESMNGLMDHALPDDDLEALRGIVAATMGGAREAHDVRSRRAGRMTFIDMHLVVDGEMRVAHAHVICDRIEAGLRERFPDLIASIHIEPLEKGKGCGGVTILGTSGAVER